MTVELLESLSLVFFILAGVMFLAGVLMFFLMDIPKLYGDISGRTAKKAIANIREQNEKSGDGANNPSAVNMRRGRLTDKISPSGKLIAGRSASNIGVGTQEFKTGELILQSNETTVLTTASNETTILNNVGNETTVLPHVSNETTVLNQNILETVQETISKQEETTQEENVVGDSTFVVDVEMNFTGSSELIE